jgi:hypothetical protein
VLRVLSLDDFSRLLPMLQLSQLSYNVATCCFNPRRDV